jgi:hypothetical protein
VRGGNGGDAFAFGGNGARSGKWLPDGGTHPLSFEHHAGRGGGASAHGGVAGAGGQEGGDGGNATARSGNGGSGGDALVANGVGGTGGSSGPVFAHGGHGGSFAPFAGIEPVGGNGGRAIGVGGRMGDGGNGTAQAGKAGTPPTDGFDVVGGDGGDGIQGGNGGDASTRAYDGGRDGAIIAPATNLGPTRASSTNHPAPVPASWLSLGTLLVSVGVHRARAKRNR